MARSVFAQAYLSNLPLDHPAVQYRGGVLDNPVSQLSQLLASGKTALEFREGSLGYLPSLLEHLGVNSDSQALVFSKTSFQASKIGPRNPRAIYFNDEVAVGWVRGGDGIEVAALDPRQGIVFYTLNAAPSGKPALTRREECLRCHQGAATLGVPGIFVGSVFPDSSGMPSRLGAIITDHRTPFADRWGGWYVNAVHGEQPDRANSIAADPAEPQVLNTAGRQNLRTLIREFNTDGYLAAVSDIVALMTFEHQTQMTNLLTRVGWEARLGLAFDADIEAAVEYMLFADEAPLREPVEGVSSFSKTFPQRGPRDRQGRGLRDFDLQTRLFRYPLSYMVYSPAFDALPDTVRDRIYRRLYDVLTKRDQSGKFANLSASDRRNILEILRDTKPNLPNYWQVAGDR
ncbi:MAG TPA: hypothetical protein VLY04_04055 [Bryobacteraceae bacterium]|nr:hypothetical protein [Bryobacteraceae bacterium]